MFNALVRRLAPKAKPLPTEDEIYIGPPVTSLSEAKLRIAEFMYLTAQEIALFSHGDPIRVAQAEERYWTLKYVYKLLRPLGEAPKEPSDER